MQNFELTSTMVDAVIILTVLISAVLAYSRGLTRELLGVLGWAAAALAALTFYPLLTPTMRGFVASDQYAKLPALAACFVIALIVVSVISPLISRLIARSRLGAVDRGLGFLFGAARGLVLLALIYIGYEAVGAADRGYATLENARTIGIVRDVAQSLKSFAPSEMPPFLQFAIDDLFGSAAPAAENPAAPG